MNILIICTGNISRSFLAEMVLENEVKEHNLDNIFISSAGLFAQPGNNPDPRMVTYLLKKEIPMKNHKARQVEKEDLDWADLILVMESSHAEMIQRLWPEANGKVELLGKYISEGQTVVDIADPFGMSSYHYRLAQAQITLAVKSFVKKVLLSRK
ncbi:MAG TPA: low molecular weight protein-tyrosine-phosphatase [Desulfatiglandales bacterium]|nr:low molecular weight protein-tyrosine-phosphatase [Desulfatiglandales bacterium]